MSIIKEVKLVIFFGAPGSGKGTQARYLEKFDNYEIFSVGELLRQQAALDTPLGKRIAEVINAGQFADISLIVDLLRAKVKHSRCILDGFPRNLKQADELDKFINENDSLKNDKLIVIDFIVDEAILLKRLNYRVICKNCDASLRPESLKCEFCGHERLDAYKRADDVQSVIFDRIKTFEEHTLPLRDFYKKKNMYYPVNANLDSLEVRSQIQNILNVLAK